MKTGAEYRGNRSAKRISYRSMVAIVAVAVILIGVAAALSMQSRQTKFAITDQRPAEKTSQAVTPGRRNYVTANADGQHVVADRMTGEVRPLTQDEATRLAAGLRQLIDQSTDGLIAINQEDGTIAMDLHGHFQNVMLAKRESDGTVSESCVDNLQSAADFFEIDPKLVGLNTPIHKGRSVPKLEDR